MKDLRDYFFEISAIVLLKLRNILISKYFLTKSLEIMQYFDFEKTFVKIRLNFTHLGLRP